jgi:hypothetical protein
VQTGTYILKLEVSDSVRIATDTVTITVQQDPTPTPPNAAPEVHAGASLEFQTFFPLSFSLRGWARDDGRPNPPAQITFEWEQVQGPDAVRFQDRTDPRTMATFFMPGRYVLRLTASDSQKEAFAEVRFTLSGSAATPNPPTRNSSNSNLINYSRGQRVAIIECDKPEVTIMGRTGSVRTLQSRDFENGWYTFEWDLKDGSDLAAAGVYVAISDAGTCDPNKLVIVK